MREALVRGQAATCPQGERAPPIDTGLRVSFPVYWYKLVHPVLERWGRFFLQGKQHRRYFVMPGDYVSGYTTKFGAFEAEEIAVARQVCRHAFGADRLARSTMVDLGCHIGNYSVELGPAFAAVLAVDAVQSYAHVARANLAWNGLEGRSTVVCAAISDFEGELLLEMERHGNLGHARVGSAEGRAPDAVGVVRVRASSLDTLLRDHSLLPVAYIKFDIEGHEIAALRGGRETIHQHTPVIQVEVDAGNLPAVLAQVADAGVGYDAWQVVRGDPRCTGRLARLWSALRCGGNPVFVQKLSGATNRRHLPCVLLVPQALGFDWNAAFPVEQWLLPLPEPLPAPPYIGAEPAPSLDDVTAVVVTYNSAHCVESMVQLLAAMPHVVVVDNGSDDGTPEQIAAALPHVRLVRLDRNVGFGSANNLALDQMATPYAFLVNPDCLVSAQSVQALMQTARLWPDAAVIVPQLLDSQGQLQSNYGWPRGQWRSRGPLADGPTCVGMACGAVMLLRLSALPLGQWFDERFFLYYEDEDLSRRLFDAHLPVVLDPRIRVLHANRSSVRGSRPLQVEYLRGLHHARSKILFVAKHEGEAAARRQRRVARWQSLAMIVVRVVFPSPRHLARAWGRAVGFWQAPCRY